MERSDWLLLVIPGIIWGASFYLIAEGLDAFDPALITPLRILFGGAVLAVIPAARQPVLRADYPKIALLALLWMVIPLSLFPFAEQRVSTSVTGMLNGATPLFVATVASIMVGYLPARRQVLGLSVGFAGVLCIAIPTAGEGGASAAGVGMILLAIMCYGFALNIAVPLQQRNGALPIVLRAQTIALAITAPFGIASIPRSTFAWHSLAAMLALGILGTGLAYAAAVTLAGRVGSTRASVTTYIIPVVSLGLGVVLLDESVALLSILGCALALVGAYVTNRTPRSS